jgi:hypothetical protein
MMTGRMHKRHRSPREDCLSPSGRKGKGCLALFFCCGWRMGGRMGIHTECNRTWESGELKVAWVWANRERRAESDVHTFCMRNGSGKRGERQVARECKRADAARLFWLADGCKQGKASFFRHALWRWVGGWLIGAFLLFCMLQVWRDELERRVG